MLLKPAPGCTVFYPGTRRQLPAAGDDIPEPLGTFWLRRISDGDVVEAKAEPATATAAAAPTMSIEAEAADLERRVAAAANPSH